jgi:hypothetical protein
MTTRRCVPVSVMVLLTLTVGRLYADEATTQPVAPENYIRFVDDAHGGGSLQTADVTFTNKDGVSVHLVAAIHIGEKGYYDGLNQDFKAYDAVLYELVKPKGMVVPAPGTPPATTQGSNPIGDFQRMLKTALDLDFQLDDVDYTPKNFVHADMDKETFEKMQEERCESFEQIMLKQIMKSFTDPQAATQEGPEDSLGDMVRILTKPDMERQIKVVLAKQLGSMDSTAMGLDGPGGSVIITERNKACLKVLTDTIADGKKKIAIFYGGAHMPDMSKHLAEMGFSPVSTSWNQAWDLKIRPDHPSAVEKMIDGLMHSLDDKDNN